MAKTDLTAERVREVLNYDQTTGFFYRKIDRFGRSIDPYKVGFEMTNGYTYVCIDKKAVRAHRLAWLYVTGQWPELLIDHINGKKADNRFFNLREATPSLNAENRHSHKSTSTTGYMGVSTQRTGWRATIKINGKHRYLGEFKTPEAAHEAYLIAKRDSHKGCTI